ncbi:S8 family serine peptidase [Chitinophaga oryzae]|uniref:S8 family serine peptidase n=1 Tax=Chitinophaga oryzae TaxID=2725414 RepID=A0AAE7D941_9BACT|nr:S8 family serine peptidase [Chitinophaga oryzae]QJB32793.1 S8 family serine peptidase [Chitinophaga oryzae]
MKNKTVKALPALLLLLSLSPSAMAQQRTREAVMIKRYAADTLTAFPTKAPLFVKFISPPEESLLSRCGVIKALTGRHYILRQLPADSTGRKKIQYSYIANANYKATDNLLKQLESLQPGDSAEVQLSYSGEHFTAPHVRTLYTIDRYHAAVVKLQQQDWPALIAMGNVTGANLVRHASPEVIINTINPYVNRINVAQQQFPAIRGKSVTVSVKEELFDTTDIDLAGRFLPSALQAKTNNAHATIMATLLAGAGNSGANGLGVAPGARLTSSSYAVLFPDPDTYYRSFGIALQNHSYGIGIEYNYDAEAVAYDQQVQEADTLTHVFSAGNSGAAIPTAGRYQGVGTYANLTGNFKQAKNVLVIGGTEANFQVATLASRGPAYDGRIKPEIVAYGQDGTSGAAALTSGVVALLQDAHRQLRGVAPSSALVRALLINSAVLPPGKGPAYTYGFGSLHAAAALTALSAGRYRQGTVLPGNTTAFDIPVPAGLRQVKVTLCWNDPAAVLNAPKALVNDLDMQAVTPDGNTWQPWVLNPFPAVDSLLQPAHRGIDSLNNTEQISIDRPAAGNLHITVKGKKVTTTNQPFYIVYDFIREPSFAWQNPVNGSMLTASQPTPLQWETTYSGAGDLAYSVDSGATWTNIAQQVPLQSPYNWNVPALFSKVWLKLTLTDTAFISPPCYIAPQLTLSTGFNCSDSAMVFWQQLPGVKGYQAYVLSQGVMTPYKQLTDTFLFIPKQSTASMYYAISPIAPAGWEGPRSYASNYALQGVGCYIKALLADPTTDNQVVLTLSLGSTYMLKSINWERRSANGWTQLGTQPAGTSTNYNFMDQNPYEGVVQYRVRLERQDGKVIYSDVSSANILLQHDILVFPNPVISQLIILDKNYRARQLVLTDMSGRIVMQRTINDIQEYIGVDRLAPGVYNCSVFLGNQRIYSRQIVKQ